MKEIRFEEEDEKKKAPEMPDPLTENRSPAFSS